MYGLVTRLKMMGVLNCAVLQNFPPNRCSCSVGASCHLLEYTILVLLLLTCKDLTIPFSLLGTLVFAIMVLPTCSSQKLRKEAESHIFLCEERCIGVGVEMHDVVQVPDPSV